MSKKQNNDNRELKKILDKMSEKDKEEYIRKIREDNYKKIGVELITEDGRKLLKD